MSSNVLHSYLVVSSKRKEISETALKILENYANKFGFDPVEGEEHKRAVLRNEILWVAFLLGHKDAIDVGGKHFQALLDDKKVHKDILSSVLKVGAATNDEATNYFLRKVR